MLSEFQYRLIQVLVLVHIWSQQLLTETEYRIQVHQLQSRRSVHTQALEVLWLTMEQRTCFYISNKPVTMAERQQYVPTSMVPNIGVSNYDD